MKTVINIVLAVLAIIAISSHGTVYAQDDREQQLVDVISNPSPMPYLRGVRLYPAVGAGGEALVCILTNPNTTEGLCLSATELAPILGMALQAVQLAKAIEESEQRGEQSI